MAGKCLICECDVVSKHYGENCTVVFDGYGDPNNTKRAEQKRRRLTKTSDDKHFNDSMNVTVRQEHFLANDKNKTRLIQLLSEKMKARGIETVVATGDADGTIVRCGLEKAALHPTVTIIGEDVDLIVLFAFARPGSNVSFMKPGRGKVESKLFSTNKLQKLPFAETILLLHAFSGCDTTSAIYNKSKGGIVKLFSKFSRKMKTISDIFTKPSTQADKVTQTGEKIFLEMYQVTADQQDLNRLRYAAFLNASTKPKPNLASLPPTIGAAQQHPFRVYLQVQQWLDNPLPPTEWGWNRGEDGLLIPVTTRDPIAPEAILNSIFCRCSTGCGGRCGCDDVVVGKLEFHAPWCAACAMCPQHGEHYIMFSPIQNTMLCVNCFRDSPNDIRSQCVDIETAHAQASKRLERGQNAIMDLQTSVRDGIIALKGLMDELRRNMDSEKHTINTFCQGMQEAMAKTHATMIMEVQRQFESKERIYRSQLIVLEQFHMVTVGPILGQNIELGTPTILFQNQR
ncbi:unnamed protein product [Phaedon cochleariae]|uniref:Uncharacterized protein n=1 Tax=Phaedon cochleariae TaxID=80249 RepID=A0A9N9SG31_PHACE|nr:unnamed protein product [Phaedon cochleariae]